MIRIDLKADELSKTPKQHHPVIQIFVDTFKKKSKGKKSKGVMRQTVSPNMVLVMFIAGAVAYLPNFVFSRYRSAVMGRYSKQISEVRKKLNGVNSEIRKLNAFKAELESFEKQKADVEKRLQVVQQLLTRRGTPVNVLDVIGQELPARTWLKRVKYKEEKGKMIEIKMDGRSFSNEEISDYVDRLNGSVYLSEVLLNSVTSGKLGPDVVIREFSITAESPYSARELSAQ